MSKFIMKKIEFKKINRKQMGYNTDFTGCIKINKPVDENTKNILFGLNNTRRMKRNVNKLAEILNISLEECVNKYGEEGEFYFIDDNEMGQSHTKDITNFNEPPTSHPGLWCNWRLNEKNNTIEWDEMDKFYDFIEWMEYLVNILSNRGYILNGKISWEGEDRDDTGTITVENNKVSS